MGKLLPLRDDRRSEWLNAVLKSSQIPGQNIADRLNEYPEFPRFFALVKNDHNARINHNAFWADASAEPMLTDGEIFLVLPDLFDTIPEDDSASQLCRDIFHRVVRIRETNPDLLYRIRDLVSEETWQSVIDNLAVFPILGWNDHRSKKNQDVFLSRYAKFDVDSEHRSFKKEP